MDDDPTLRERSLKVTGFGYGLADLVAAMLTVCRRQRAWGLSAVQIGFPQRVIVAKDVEGDGEYRVFINPVLTRTLNREAVDREGCLSVAPERWRNVARPAKCELEWQDTEGQAHSGGFSGKLARIIQHEIDHLDGVLITDKPPC